MIVDSEKHTSLQHFGNDRKQSNTPVIADNVFAARLVTGVRFAYFHLSGNCPEASDLLKRHVNGSASSTARSLRKRELTSSGPGIFEELSVLSTLYTSSVESVMTDISFDRCGTMKWMPGGGGSERGD